MRFAGRAAAGLVAFFAISVQAFAYDCQSDCSGSAYNFPCPNWHNPFEVCEGHLPNDPACMTAKAMSCQIWEGAVNYVGPKIRPALETHFNHHKWTSAVMSHSTDEYMASCVAAGVAACGALGAELGGPWGATATGAIGTFVSFRICDQSKSW